MHKDKIQLKGKCAKKNSSHFVLALVLTLFNISCEPKLELEYSNETIEKKEFDFLASNDWCKTNHSRFFFDEKYDIFDKKEYKFLHKKHKARIICKYSRKPVLVLKNLENKYGIVDLNLKQILPFEYDSIGYFKTGPYYTPDLISVIKENKYGILDKDFQLIIEPKYQWAYKTISHDMIFIKDNNKFGAISKTEDLIIPMVYDSIASPDGANVHVYVNSKIGLMTNEINLITDIKYDEVKFLLGYSFKEDVKESNTLYSFKIGDKYGVLSDKTGEILTDLSDVPIKYLFVNIGGVYRVNDFSEYKADLLFVFQKSNKVGVVNIDGRMIIDPIYDEIKYNHDDKKIELIVGEKVRTLNVSFDGFSIIVDKNG